MYQTKELREQRYKLVQDANAILDKVNSEKRDMTSEENQKFEALHADADKLRVKIDQFEKANEATRSLQQVAEQEQEVGKKNETRSISVDAKEARESKTESSMDSFRAYLLGDPRALSSGSNTAGGYLLPTSLSNRIFEVQKTLGGIAKVATIVDTASGENLSLPVWDDTGNAAQIEGESDQLASNVDPSTGTFTLNVHKFSSNIVKVPFELLQDSVVNLEQFIGKSLSIRIARKTNYYWTVGDGTGEPYGAITQATVGKTVSATNAITAAELINFMHSVDPIYRQNGAWMMNDTTLAYFRTLTDSYGQLMWQISLREGQPDTLLGKPVVFNPDMAGTLEASAIVVAFGDWSAYHIRFAGDLRVKRLNELYAENDYVGFLVLGRYGGNLAYDSNVTAAASCPIRTLKMATA